MKEKTIIERKKSAWALLMAQPISGTQQFVNWVHKNPVFSFLVLIMFFVIPVITWFIGYFGYKSSETLVDNFVEKISKIESRNTYTGTYTELDELVNSLPTGMQDTAQGIIREYMNPKKYESVDPEANLAKEKVLSLLDTAPKSFLWNKEKLSDLLKIEKRNGEFFLVFTEDYKQAKDFYTGEGKRAAEYMAGFFKTFISNIFAVSVEIEEKDYSSGSMIKICGVTFTCRVSVQDIHKAELNPKVLHNFYQAYEVVGIFKAAILYWAGQVDNVHHKELVKNIVNDLKPVSNSHGGFNITSSYKSGWIGIGFDGKSRKEEGLKHDQEIHKASIAQLKNYLDEFFGEETFSLNGIFNVQSRDDNNSVDVTKEVEFMVGADKFEAILGKVAKKNGQPTIGFGSMFHQGKVKEGCDNDVEARSGKQLELCN